MKKSIYKGVHWSTKENRWIATYAGKRIGAYKTDLEAVKERDRYLIDLGLVDKLQIFKLKT